MFSKKLILLLCLFTSSTFAQTIKLAPGTWYGTGKVIITVNAQGQMSVTLDNTSSITITGTTSPPIDPDDPDDPDEPDPTDRLSVLRAAVTKATAGVNQAEPFKTNTRVTLAKLYRTIAGISLLTTRAQLTTATDTLFNSLGMNAEWIQWKKLIDQALVEFSDLDAAKKAWIVVAESLETK